MFSIYKNQSKYLLRKEIIKERDNLLLGLDSINNLRSWGDVTDIEGGEELWSSIEILNSYLHTKIIPPNFQLIIKNLNDSRKEINNNYAWEHSNNIGWANTYMICDIIKLKLKTYNYDEVFELIRILKDNRNSDGGWGIALKDTASKIRPTAWVLECFCLIYNNPPTKHFISLNDCVQIANHLINIQNTKQKGGSGGWANTMKSSQSNITSTTFVLISLIEIYNILNKDKNKKSNNLNLTQIRNSIKEGYYSIKNEICIFPYHGSDEYLKIELISREPNKMFRGGGCGVVIVIPLLIKLYKTDIKEINKKSLKKSIYENAKFLLRKTKKYKNFPGKWICPSESNSEPVAWNSAFAIISFNYLIDFYGDSLIFDSKKINLLVSTIFFLSITIIIYIVFIILRSVNLVQISKLIETKPILIQELIFILISFFSSGFLSGLFKFINLILNKLLILRIKK